MKTRFSLSIFRILLAILVNFTNSYAQTYTYSITGGGTADVNGVYVQTGTNSNDNNTPVYTKVSGSGTTNSCYVYRVSWWLVNNTQNLSNSNDYYYYWVNQGKATMPINNVDTGNWSTSFNGKGTGTCYTAQNSIVQITFSNGSGFTPSTATLPTTNNPIGRFQLLGSSVGGVLQSVTVSLTGTRTGVSNIKLWSSSSSTFNSGTSTTLATVVTDAASVTFSGFNSLVDNTSGTYYFVTVDLSSSATGSMTSTIPSQASFTFAGANNPNSFTNASLSSAAAPLPVELINFSAQPIGNSVILNWQTATEVNNYGFEIERRTEKGSWNKIGFVIGSGNSNSPKSYSFIDKNITSGIYSYRLKQIDFDGKFEYSKEKEVTIDKPTEFSLAQNFPNPFNPTTKIKYSIPTSEKVMIKVYDVLGREVKILQNEYKDAGAYEIEFDASKLTSGVYFYNIISGSNSETRKMMLIR